MRTNYRTVLAGAIITASLSAGCVAIISSDTPHYHDEDCSNCHDTVVILGKQTADSTVIAESVRPQ